MQDKLEQNAAAGNTEGLNYPIAGLGHPTAFVITVHLFRQFHLSFVDFDAE